MSEYDFFLNPQSQPPQNRYTRAGKGQSSMAKRLGVVLGVVFGLIILLWIVFGVLLKPDSGPTDRMAALAVTQADLINLSNNYKSKLRSSEAIELAAGARALLTSDKQAIDTVLTESGREVSKEELASGTDADIRTLLTAAEGANKLDESFIDNYTESLLVYRSQIAEAYSGTSNETHKEIYNTAYRNVSILLGLDIPTQPAAQ